MKINLPGAFADAWGMFRQQREVLIAIVGLFIFLPTLALLLLVPVAPPWPDSTATDAEIRSAAALLADWLVGNSRWFLAAALASLYASMTICVVLLDRRSADVSAALARALQLTPRYMLAALLILVPASLGLFMLVLPGLYVMGRTMMIAPVLVVEQPITATSAIMRSIALSRRNGLALAALTGLGLLAGQLLPSPFQSIDVALRAAHAANPVVLTLVDSAAAGMATIVALATILVRIAVYRQVMASNGT